MRQGRGRVDVWTLAETETTPKASGSSKGKDKDPKRKTATVLAAEPDRKSPHKMNGER